ncbi:hypothetical protein A2680_03095 [Candidatus Kaiserbacteria bacterium RIFCSPHIGHO2_01_FULL_55_37]|nr:MAG: hypothetical protein A2680_03095 [Candidatus Kaiserbacteria bacterium RIFCSPHIGHO2_01_FULL_55_37]
MQTLIQHKILLVVTALVIAGGVWYGMSSTPASPDLAPTATSADVAPVDQGIVQILLTLRAVKLDGMIFSDPTFMKLQDFSTEIQPETVGRTNPFAPIAPQSQTSTSSTQVFTPAGR